MYIIFFMEETLSQIFWILYGSDELLTFFLSSVHDGIWIEFRLGSALSPQLKSGSLAALYETVGHATEEQCKLFTVPLSISCFRSKLQNNSTDNLDKSMSTRFSPL